ncbi:MAG: four helix bundle protein [Bacteroidetes bacterium]|nr:four helix bundle protein [Bacteroidota bacterium]
MKRAEDNIIVTITFEFACDVIDVYLRLSALRHFRIADQLCGSGTSIGANVREAQRAVSKADFINKMGIALKEAEETGFWFEVIERKLFNIDNKLKDDLRSIIRILITIIKSSKGNK